MPSRVSQRQRVTRHPFYRSPVLWSRSYCVISVGGAPLEVLEAYIQQQDAPT
ncbi:transposase [Thiomonas sp. FB-Cd]|uniref:transposase n=1 Tax=Thiomonas sp. FB-Cd TaxID=1158292 RepID=UPI0009DEB163|nr:transposase [Thiomonas sp. FB-Cd]